MKWYNYIYWLFVILIFSECREESFDNGLSQDLSNKDMLSLTFQSNQMLPHQVTSRVSDPKEEAEKRINTLHIFFFNEKGEYLLGSYLDGYKEEAAEQGGYCAPGKGATILKIDRSQGAFNNLDEAKNVTIVAVANVQDGWFASRDENRLPDNVTKLEDLRKMVYNPLEVTLDIPREGMPMYGEVSGQDLTTDKANALIIPMKALMARVDVLFSIDSEHSDPTGLLPSMQMSDWTVYNVPTSVAFAKPASSTGALGDKKKEIKVPNSQKLFNHNGELKLSFYMFENMQDKKEVNPSPYPPGLQEDQKQRYKPLFANEDAAYVAIHGYYATYNEDGSGSSTYDVTYNLYLGANHTDNFKVERNKQYKNNVKVHGITEALEDPNHVTLDTRVDISSSNPFFVSILRERDHDAHFCVTPMDIYLFDDEGEGDNVKMTVSVVNPEKNTWLRLEKVSAAHMAAGTAPNENCLSTPGNLPFHAGNGKRKFFTTSLLRELPSTVELNTSRDRVYIYLDENLVLEDRTAQLELVYTGKDGKIITKFLEIGQTHLIKINVDGDIIYMERYEEYLNHYDPLDEFNDSQLYAGLEWGANGRTFETLRWGPTMVDGKICDPEHNWYNGYEYTGYMIQSMGQVVMTLNDTPKSALQYCHNKNKRQVDGVIPYIAERGWGGAWHIPLNKTKWFLPGIREMERALTQQYNTFPEFQGNYYWSCSVGEEDGETSGQNSQRARATKVRDVITNPNDQYEQSGGAGNYYYEQGRGGYAKRTEKLRIRAFRIDLQPSNY